MKELIVKGFKILIHIVFIFFSLCAEEYKEATDILNQCSSIKVISVDQARDLITDLWLHSLCYVEAPSPVQKLTKGFQLLIQKLDNIPQRSLVEQIYLMWFSGRTHGFSSQGSAEDEESVNSTLRVVVRNIATNLMKRKEPSSIDSLTPTEQVINNMLQDNTVNSCIRHQDDKIIKFIRKELYDLFCEKLDIQNLGVFVNSNPLEEHSISGIWNAYCKDVWNVIIQHKELSSLVGTMPQRFDQQKHEYLKINERVIESRLSLCSLNDAIRECEKVLFDLRKQIDIVKKQKQGLEYDVDNLSPQIQQLQEEIRHLEEERELSQSTKRKLDEESAHKRSEQIIPEKTNVVRSLFPSPTSSTKKFWSSSTSSKFLLRGRSCILAPFHYDYSSSNYKDSYFKPGQYPGLWALLSSIRCNEMNTTLVCPR